MPQEFEPSASETTVPPVGIPYDPAAQRVTPEELSAALKALEGRPSRPLPAAETAPASAHVPDTLTLGEAADALSLSIPPEELWREVQQQRDRKEQAERDLAQREQARREQPVREQSPPPFQQIPPLQTPPAFIGLAGRGSRFGNGAQRGGRRRWIGIALGTFLVIRLLSGFGHHTPPSLSPTSVSSMAAGHDLAVNADAQSLVVNAAGGTLTVNGDADTVTVNGACDKVIVNGDADTVRVHGSVQSVTFNGDASRVTYSSAPTPSVSYNGDGNSARPQ